MGVEVGVGAGVATTGLAATGRVLPVEGASAGGVETCVEELELVICAAGEVV